LGIVTLTGRFSLAEASEVDAAIRTAAVGGNAVVVDLTRTVLIDAMIARVLRTANARCARGGIGFAAAGATGQPLQVLEVLGMAKDLNAYLTAAEAVDDLGHAPTEHARVTLDALVHRLLTQATDPDTSPPERDRLRHEAIEAALPLARSMARRYQRRSEPLDDLIQVASLGLTRAVQGYDPARGSGFLAYAMPTILGELRKHFRDHTWAVRPPRATQELRSAALVAWPDLSQQLGRPPTAAELAAHLGTDRERIDEAILCGSGHRPPSLDAPLTDSERSLHDVIGAADSNLELAEIRLALAPLMAGLSERTRAILKLRMTTDLTQAEIGARIGISQMGVSRALSSAYAMFRRALAATD
jgi:RNA polymerase sigma-B factor